MVREAQNVGFDALVVGCDALAEALIAKGCTVQLEALGASMEASAEAAG